MKIEMVVMFWAKPRAEVLAKLKAAGLRWFHSRGTWEGIAEYDEIRPLVGKNVTIINVVKTKGGRWMK